MKNRQNLTNAQIVFNTLYQNAPLPKEAIDFLVPPKNNLPPVVILHEKTIEELEQKLICQLTKGYKIHGKIEFINGEFFQTCTLS